jgi:hypothetical protein
MLTNPPFDSALKHRHTVVATVSDAGLMTENANMVDTNWAAADAALALRLEMWNVDGEIHPMSAATPS